MLSASAAAPFTLSGARADGLIKSDDGSTAPRDHTRAVTEGTKEALAKVSVALSLAECVAGRNLIIEAVPDYADIKGGVFREAIQHCAEDAVLTTNTLSVTLQEICVSNLCLLPFRRVVPWSYRHRPDLGVRLCLQAYLPPEWHNRLLGLRFLAPVMFVPLCEITYRAGAQDTEKQRLSHMMEAVDKVVFDCPQMVEAQGGAAPSVAGGRPGSQRESPYWLGYSRLRLNDTEVRRHQAREARLWLLHRTGQDDSMRRMTSQGADMEEMCVVCLTNPREALSISCGHKVMCPDCAARVKMINSSCPFCRVAMREVVLSKGLSTESAGSDLGAEMTGGAEGTDGAVAAAGGAADTAPTRTEPIALPTNVLGDATGEEVPAAADARGGDEGAPEQVAVPAPVAADELEAESSDGAAAAGYGV